MSIFENPKILLENRSFVTIMKIYRLVTKKKSKFCDANFFRFYLGDFYLRLLYEE